MSVIKTLIGSALSFDLSTFLVFVAVLLVTYLFVKRLTGGKLPPGPPCLPIVGSAWFLDTTRLFHEEMKRLSKKYNSDILSVNVYGRQMIVLQTYELAKEAFQKRTDMTDRTERSFVKAHDPNHNGILASSGQTWKDHRRFTLFMLRDFGMGKIAAEQSIQDEAIQLCNRIEQLAKTQGAFDPLPVLEPAVSNVICAMAFGKRYDYEDKEFNLALTSLNEMIQEFTSTYSQVLMSPRLHWIARYLFPDSAKLMEKNYVTFSDFLDKMIQEHRAKFDGSVNDLIDGYFVEQKKRAAEKDPSSDGQTFTDANLRYLIQDLFLAGSETTTTTLRWCLLFLVKYPECQDKVYEELVGVIGPDRLPNMGDKKNTPYTEAFMMEIQRFNTIVPNSVAHSCSEDIELRGYNIPAKAFIISNLAGIHRDERVFDEPDKFKVERFLQGDNIINTDQVIQFGIGRRACAGEALARMELYLFFTTVVLKFKLEPADDAIDLRGGLGSIYAPKDFNIRAIAR